MKYSKIVEKNIHKINIYFISFMFTILLFIASLYSLSISVKGTFSWFTNTEVVMLYRTFYYPNWPLQNSPNAYYEEFYDEYTFTDNMFGVPEGYEFICWNTKADGSGTNYQVGDSDVFSDYIFVFAQWKKLVDDEDITDNPDVEEDVPNDNPTDDENNNDSGENPEDNGNNSSEEEDDTLPDDDNSSTDSEDSGSSEEDNSTNEDDSSDNNVSGDNNSSTGSNNNSNGSGSGTVGGSSNGGGTGTGSSGNGNSSTNSTGGSQNGSSSSDNVISSDDNKEDDKIEDTEVEKVKKYYFNFMVGVKDFNKTSCNVLDDGKCKLVLPENNPVKDGYTFKGWSLTNLCKSEDIISEVIDMNSNATYYACFDINVEPVKNKNTWIYLIVSVWVITGVIIYRMIKIFRNKSENIDID